MPAMIRTYPSRTMIDLEHPDPAKIHVEDIAHSLARTCRYAGHCRDFYSVAEHSLLVETLGQGRVVQKNQLMAYLLHDASEAYLGDVTSPLKSLLLSYQDLERRWDAVIRETFGLPTDDDLVWRGVGLADRRALELEQYVLCWDPSLPESSGVDIKCWSPAEAGRRFLHRFHQLGSGA